MLRLPIDHQVLTGAVAFLRALNWGTPSLFLYFTLRRYLQAFNHARPIAFALVSANIINVLGNWTLIYGHTWGTIHIPAGLLSRAPVTVFLIVAIALFSLQMAFLL